MGLELMNAAAAPATPYATELTRILKLPKRQILNCERDEQRRWAPEAQALIEVMTAKYARGPRLSCGCQKRAVTLARGGQLTVFREARPNQPPPPPLLTSMDAFLADNAHNAETVEKVRGMIPGQTIELAGLGAPACLTELNAVQAWVLWELPRTNGVLGYVSTGGGKTLLGILASLAIPGAETVILLAKPDQRMHYRNAYLRLREHFRVPSMVFENSGPGWSFVIPGARVLRFVPYSTLSNPKSTELLESYEPHAIIGDELHSLASKRSSRTMRFLRYMAKHTNVIFCGWSGSLIKKSVRDVSHLSSHALGLGSPYPIRPSEVDAWAQVMDPIGMPDTTSTTAAELYSAFAGQDIFAASESARLLASLDDVQPLREGFRDRVFATPGIISTASSSITCSLTIYQRHPPKLPDEVRAALSKIRNDAEDLDGNPLVEALDRVVCAREVAAGFYAYWAFVNDEPRELIEDWYAARKIWNKALRAKLTHGQPHLDSPQLCENAAERAFRQPPYEGTLPLWPEPSWPDWARIKDSVKPDPRVRWVSEYLAKDAAEWAQEHVGIIWVQSIPFGKKIAKLAGINYHGGGPNCEKEILAEDGKRSIVASIKAHGEGRDELQYRFAKQLVAELPSSADRWQQLLARLARPGQDAETVETWIYAHVDEYREAFRKAVMLAEYLETTTPNKQLLLAADLDIDFTL